ncbi:glycosyltransferase [Kineococcus terrestris]|uniref:glycosyltransferase n=1 Tax=Kineococcus terrestris TaxID=2044856 RepID=UPI0034DB4AF9
MHHLLALWEGGGTVPVELGVTRRLLSRGHTATVLGDPTMEGAVTALGAEFRPWVEAPHRVDEGVDGDLFRDWECRTPFGQFARVRDRLFTGPAAAFSRDTRRVLAERPADVLLANGALLGALAGAESLGVPQVCLMPNIYFAPAPGMPPLGLGLRPARGPLGRARDDLVNGAVRRMWDRGMGDFNAARALLGLPPVRTVYEQWDHAARVLVLTSRAFDFPARLPANVRYVGPVLDDPPWAGPVDLPPGDEPLVVVGLSSSYMRQVPLLRRVVAALDRLPVRGLVTTGPAVDPGEVPGTDRVHVVRSAPHAQVFPLAAVVVTHAGHGTTVKALAAGAAVLGLPMGRDQADNVVRFVHRGAGLGLKPTASTAAIARAVRRLLEEPSFRAAAARLGRALREDAASSPLLEEVEAAGSRAPRETVP